MRPERMRLDGCVYVEAPAQPRCGRLRGSLGRSTVLLILMRTMSKTEWQVSVLALHEAIMSKYELRV